jgi:malic enzyme
LHRQKQLPNMSQDGSVPNNVRDSLRKAALECHEFPVPGKLSVTPTKQLTNQRDLALAYSPGVAAASEEIVGRRPGQRFPLHIVATPMAPVHKVMEVTRRSA